MDPNILEKALQKDKNKNIKAAIIVDYGGQPAQWDKFLSLKRFPEKNLYSFYIF